MIEAIGVSKRQVKLLADDGTNISVESFPGSIRAV
jgi:hypothetical protein